MAFTTRCDPKTSGEGRTLGPPTLLAIALACALAPPSPARAHAVLRPGDVVVVGIAPASGPSPGVLYVAFLAPLHVDGELRFTDDGLRVDGTFRRTEGTSLLEAVRMPIERGTVLSVDLNTISLGARDQVAIYEGRIDPSGELSGGRLTFQATWGGPFVLDATSDATSALDPSLGLASIALSASAEAYEYFGRTSGTRAQILAQIHDPSFWRTTTRALLAPPSAFVVTPVRGEPCASATECPSGLFCVDDVCCESSCGGGDPTDCIACNFGATPESGTCGTEPPEHLCRSAAGYCDLPEQCDGVSPTCPPDRLVPGGFVCRPVRDLCDVAEVCDGVSLACPLDGFAGPERVCREAVDACDVAEVCDGALRCPDDVLACFDAGPPQPDVGPVDAGSDVGLDAGAEDVGIDVGRSDAADAAVDAEVRDASIDALDAADDGGPSTGCSCGVPQRGSRSSGGFAGLSLLAGLLLRRRR